MMLFDVRSVLEAETLLLGPLIPAQDSTNISLRSIPPVFSPIPPSPLKSRELWKDKRGSLSLLV
jgi:hypothetical protein